MTAALARPATVFSVVLLCEYPIFVVPMLAPVEGLLSRRGGGGSVSSLLRHGDGSACGERESVCVREREREREGREMLCVCVYV